MTSDEANGCSSKARIPSSSPTSARCRNEIDQPLVGRVGVDGRHLAVTDAGGRVEHFATGARQFVVHDAFAITSCRTGWYASKLTPRTNVGTPSLASAEITLRSPAASERLRRPASGTCPSPRSRRRLRVLPTEGGRIALREDPNLLPVDLDGSRTRVDSAGEPAVDAVARQQIRERLGAREVVDRYPLDVRLVFDRCAKGRASHPSESVDGRSLLSPVVSVLAGRGSAPSVVGRTTNGSVRGSRPRIAEALHVAIECLDNGRVPDVSDRLRALLDAGIALNSELSLDALLQRLVETAAELTGARYAALGVIDKSGQTLERFLTTGIDAETHAAIGELPRGRGILGVLIRDAQPLRLDDIATDPRSVGFPRDHPPMKSFLGVPILQRGVAFGNLYLTEKEDSDPFTDEDVELTQLLAAQAGVAIENARLYESATRWLRQFETLNEIGNAIASEVELSPLLELVARRLRELIEARIVLIALPAASGELTVAAADGESTFGIVGMSLAVDHSKSGRILERVRSERVDSVLEDPEIDQQVARRLGVHSGLYVPLIVGGQAIGVVVAHDRSGPDPRFTDDDLRLAETLAARAATGVDLSQRVSRDAVRRVVEAQELERKRLARELHDETGQALTSILLGLKPLEAATKGETRESVLALRELVVATLQDVRRLAV